LYRGIAELATGDAVLVKRAIGQMPTAVSSSRSSPPRRSINLTVSSTVDATTVPGSLLGSDKLAAWRPAANALIGDPLIIGGALAAMDHAYCYQAHELLPAVFGVSRTAGPGQAKDLRCMAGGVVATTPYDQTTFPYVNRPQEIHLDAHLAEDFNLFDTCRNELKLSPPSGTATHADLDATKSCVSLAQFFTAMRANVDSTGAPIAAALPQAQMVNQLLRQWLGVHAYLANGAIQNKNLDEALGSSSTATHVELGETVDIVDQGLRVLLDPAVKPLFTSAATADAALATPDYRSGILSRPVAHWDFNVTQGPDHGTEGNIDFALGNVDLSAGHSIFTTRGDGTCMTNGRSRSTIPSSRSRSRWGTISIAAPSRSSRRTPPMVTRSSSMPRRASRPVPAR
jgi:hypothetical protein